MSKRIWEISKIVIILFWLFLFILSFFYSSLWLNILSGIIAFIFAIELLVLFTIAPSKRDFFKTNWHEILFLIPIFRFLKVGKIAKLFKIKKVLHLKRAMSTAEKLYEGADLASKAREEFQSKK